MTTAAKRASKAKKTAAESEGVKYPRKAVPAYVNAGATELEAARAYTALATSPDLAAYRVIAAAEKKQ